MIYESTHVIGERSSCEQLIFVVQPNLVVKSDIQSSLHKIVITK